MKSETTLWFSCRNFLFYLLSAAIGIGFFVSESGAYQSSAKKVAMCSTTQIADFTRQIVGERWEVICVLGPGQDPHTYEVGNDDLLAVQRADLCLHNGWNLEGHDWMRILAQNSGKPLITCTNNVPPLSVEGGHGPQAVKDPHAWFDVDRSIIYVQNILAGIQQADPARAKEYQERADEYVLKLRELDCWIREQVNSIPCNRRILVTHHDAFRYFCNAYGFQAMSPLSWTTGELTDVTIEQRQTIIRKIRALGIKSLFVESTINRELLDGIAHDAGISIGGELYSDAMGATGTLGETYLGMMRHNVEMMVKHLK